MPVTFKFVPILPKRHNYPLDIVDRLEQEVEGTLNGTIRRSLELSFDRRVSGWKNKPGFKSTFNRRTRKGALTGFALLVAPAGKNKRLWVFVSGGVPQHTIIPRRRKLLRVRGGIGGYAPLTEPGDRYGGVGGYIEDMTFYARRVNHPGIKPRSFETYIAKENEALVVMELTKAVARALL
jgi:hypothetical protein